jgi:hypothetical protein
VYNYASPYTSDRKYCSHGAYYTEGNLVNQQKDCDGILVTKFTWGFDVIWFKQQDFDEELLPNVATLINEVFLDQDFLAFLQTEYPDYDFIQDNDMCTAVNPDEITVTLAPTEPPSPNPTSLLDNGQGPCTSNAQCKSGYCFEETNICTCDMETNEGCNSNQVCRFSCAFIADEPRCFDDEQIRDCESKWGEGYVCADGNGDGIVDQNDKSGGCDYNAPTSSPVKDPSASPSSGPTTFSPTVSVQATLPPTSTIVTKIPTLSPTSGNTDTLGSLTTGLPTFSQIQPAITEPPTITVITPVPTSAPQEANCSKCDITVPDDTEQDECPIVTIATCGNGNRGDGICPFAGYCCSEWGWCGTTAEYCDDNSVAPSPSAVEGAPVSPTYSIDAGKCGNGLLGEEICAETDHCCSEWGYCGVGENYCFTTTSVEDSSSNATEDETDLIGTCGGGGIGNGLCNDGLCCSKFGFCGQGELYCTGVNAEIESDITPNEAEIIVDNSPLPKDLKPTYGYRCGTTELDARANCKPQCTHHIQCSDGEECWGVALNNCNAFEEGTHPICDDLEMADNDNRCGYDELSARSFCGMKCTTDTDCGAGEYCFPTHLNLCDCHENNDPEEATIVFASAKALVSPYFLKTNPSTATEGIPRNASFHLKLSVRFAMLLPVNIFWMMM